MKTKRPNGEWGNEEFIINCKKCGTKGSYSWWDDGYDAYFCKQCNEWIDSKCSDPECEFCKDRPERPMKDGKLLVKEYLFGQH